MRKIPLLLLLACTLAGCASHEDKNKNPYEQWEKKHEADDEDTFFYGSWLHPLYRDNDEIVHSPSGITTAPPPSQ
ncbi:MAG TPA: hypothetical protein VG733_15350 [Chthoniobacteraceae bacterium]|nr:hypothetical protein [Chthoniobacteraceae bacterium]